LKYHAQRDASAHRNTVPGGGLETEILGRVARGLRERSVALLHLCLRNGAVFGQNEHQVDHGVSVRVPRVRNRDRTDRGGRRDAGRRRAGGCGRK
jgi:hypothetical protein